MKKQVFATVLALGTTYCYAQEKSSETTTITKATFLNPGISYERPLSNKQTLYLQGYLSTSAYFMYSDALGTSAGIRFNPALTAQYRFYYNLDKRQASGKRTAMNSANYISPVIDLTFIARQVSDTFELAPSYTVLTFGGVWGLQRNFFKRFSLDLNLGLGYLFTKRNYRDESYRSGYPRIESTFTPLAKINLGFWLNKRIEK